MRSAGVGAAGAEGRIDLLEDNAFTIGSAEFLVDFDLVVRVHRGADPAQSREIGRDGHDESGETIEVATVTEVVAFHFEQVEGMQRVANGLAIDEDIERDVFDGLADRIRNGDGQSPADAEL